MRFRTRDRRSFFEHPKHPSKRCVSSLSLVGCPFQDTQTHIHTHTYTRNGYRTIWSETVYQVSLWYISMRQGGYFKCTSIQQTPKFRNFNKDYYVDVCVLGVFVRSGWGRQSSYTLFLSHSYSLLLKHTHTHTLLSLHTKLMGTQAAGAPCRWQNFSNYPITCRKPSRGCWERVLLTFKCDTCFPTSESEAAQLRFLGILAG